MDLAAAGVEVVVVVVAAARATGITTTAVVDEEMTMGRMPSTGQISIALEKEVALDVPGGAGW